MSDYIQTLNTLASVTSLSQLRLDKEGQLEKRSVLSTLGHRIADAFRSLSAEGRTAITARNAELFSAMQKAVDESTHHEVFLAREAGAKLSSALVRLTDCYSAALKNGIMGDPRVAALPEVARLALQSGLEFISSEHPHAEWRGLMNTLRDTFLGVLPEGFSLEKGVETFAKGLRSTFLDISKSLDEYGIHDVYYRDMERGGVKNIGGTPIKGVQIKQDFPDPAVHRAMYRALLSNFLADSSSGKFADDLKFLPFLAVACTQNGTASACPLLIRDSGFDVVKQLALSGIATRPGGTSYSTSIVRDTENPRHILVRSDSSQMYFVNGDKSRPALRLETGITMRIDFGAEYTEPNADGKPILPSFTLENAYTRITAEGL